VAAVEPDKIERDELVDMTDGVVETLEESEDNWL
jgi:hypothetical protein